MTKLNPTPNGGVVWYVPKRKRPVAETTTATSDLISIIVADGAQSFNEVRKTVRYDSDAIALCDIMTKHGLGDARIETVAGGFVGFIQDGEEE